MEKGIAFINGMKCFFTSPTWVIKKIRIFVVNIFIYFEKKIQNKTIFHFNYFKSSKNLLFSRKGFLNDHEFLGYFFFHFLFTMVVIHTHTYTHEILFFLEQ